MSYNGGLWNKTELGRLPSLHNQQFVQGNCGSMHNMYVPGEVQKGPSVSKGFRKEQHGVLRKVTVHQHHLNFMSVYFCPVTVLK